VYNFACDFECVRNLVSELREEFEVFENKVLRRIFGRKRDEVTGRWRKLHNEELHDLCSSPSIIRLIKSRNMRWARHFLDKRFTGGGEAVSLICRQRFIHHEHSWYLFPLEAINSRAIMQLE
jgi:hypothetical protein